MLPSIVKALIFTQDYDSLKLLILTRSATASSAGMDDLPGGKVNPKEPLQDALIREIYEETQLRVTASDPFITQEWLWPNGVTTMTHLFIDRIPLQPITIDPTEHSSYRWIPFTQLSQSSLLPEAIKILLMHEDQIKKYLK